MKQRIFDLAAAALSVYACWLGRVHETPIDRALPFLALVMCAIGAFEAVPLLVVCEIALPDERLRLLAIGCVLAYGVLRPCRSFQSGGMAAALQTTAAILLLRWIPFPDHPIRELLLVAVCLGIVAVLRGTPLAMAIAILTALATPMIPLRTLALPLLVLVIAAIASVFGADKIRATLPSALVIAFVLIFFAWSGIVARAVPYFFRPARPELPRLIVDQALAPSQSLVLDVPPGVHSLIVSGANVPRLKRGTLLGSLNERPIRIGDAADWGCLRRDFFYGSRNPLPRDAAGRVRGYGYSAWIDGAGRIAIPANARRIRITAASTLPRDASLQVEAFE